MRLECLKPLVCELATGAKKTIDAENEAHKAMYAQIDAEEDLKHLKRRIKEQKKKPALVVPMSNGA